MIILLVTTSQYIYSPMYFFLSHLSLNDIVLTTTIVPQMLYIILKEGTTMSFTSCFTQFYFISLAVANECLLLTIMSYDRYLAICNPLRYSSIMDLRCCALIASLSWVTGILLGLPHVLILSKMTFCGSNIMNHFYCDILPLLNVTCSSRFANEVAAFVLSIPLTLLPIVFITMTYISILLVILRISTTTGRQKAFSTCSSHLTVVCLYYGTLVFNYVIPSRGDYLPLQKIISVLYTIVTPLLNPIVYSLNNVEIRGTLMRFILKRKIISKLN
ncbi:olfactory receptor 11L1-like [Pelodytes ibericus]